jgi:hypothetical protein
MQRSPHAVNSGNTEDIPLDFVRRFFLFYCLKRDLLHRKYIQCVKVKVKVKVKVTLEQATKAQRGSRGIALLFL